MNKRRWNLRKGCFTKFAKYGQKISFVFLLVLTMSAMPAIAANDPVDVTVSKDFGPGYAIEGSGDTTINGVFVNENVEALFGVGSSVAISDAEYASGLHTNGNNARIVYGDSADISVEGELQAIGVFVEGDNAKVEFGDNAKITTETDDGVFKGLYLAGDGSQVILGNNAELNVTDGNGGHGNGIELYGDNAKVEFGDGAKISFKTDNYDYAIAAAIYLSGENGEVVLKDDAEILVSGYQSRAIDIADWTGQSKVTIGDNATISGDIDAGDDLNNLIIVDYGNKLTIGNDAKINYTYSGSDEYGDGAAIKINDLDSGSEISIGDGAIIRVDGFNRGAEVDGEGAKLSFGTSLDLSVKGNGATGLSLAADDSQLIVGDGAKIVVSGDYSKGIQIGDGGNMNVEIGNNTQVEAYGEDAYALEALLYADESSTVSVGDNAKFYADGYNASGVEGSYNVHLTIGKGAEIVLESRSDDDGDYSESSYAIAASSGALVELGEGSSIRAYGDNVIGAAADGYDDEIGELFIGNSVDILVSGDGSSQYAGAAGVKAQSDGYIEVAEGASIQAQGAYSKGVWSYGGEIDVEDGATIVVSGKNATGARVSASGVLSLKDNTKIEVRGEGTRGVAAIAEYGSAELTIGDNLSVTAIGEQTQGSFGVAGIYSGKGDYGTTNRLVVGKNASVDVYGYNAMGIYGYWGGQIEVSDDASIFAEGESSRGVVVQHTSADVILGDRLSVTASGDKAIGLMATASAGYAGSSITTGDDAVVTVTGNDGASGIYATRGVVTTGSGANVSMSGSSGYGLRAATDGEILLGENAIVTVTGNNSHGAYASGGKISISDSSSISTSGDNGYGLYANNGVIDVTGSAVKTSGSGAHGIYSNGVSGDITMRDSTIGVANDDAWYMIADQGGKIRLENMMVGDGVNLNLLKSSSSGDVVALHTNLEGNVVHDATAEGVLSLTLSGDSSLTGSVNVLGANTQSLGALALNPNAKIDITLDANAWNVTGDSYTQGKLDMGMGGMVNFEDRATLGSKVRVNELMGEGTFSMRADIPAQTADRLIVEGTSTGDHQLDIRPVGNAQATGYERVMLVETADKDSSFELTTGVVDFGGFQYKLRVNSDGKGEFDAANGQYWELYNKEQGSDPDSSNTGSDAISTFMGSYYLAYADTDTLIKRVGDLRNNTYQHGAWFRAYGGKFESDARHYVKDFDQDYWAVQVGYDNKLDRDRSWFKKGDTYVGTYIGLGNSDIDFTSGGSGEIKQHTMGMYWTYIGDSGFYFDAVAKYIWGENKFHSFDSARDFVDGGEINSSGAGLSFEAGKRFRFNKNNKGNWYVEPQLQLSWQHMGGGTFHASNGLNIGVDSWDSLIGRAGMLLGYETAKTNFYAKVSYLKEFDGDINIHANGVNTCESMDDKWWVYGIGLTHQMNATNALYLDFERASGGDFTQTWQINAGWRISF